MEHAATKDTAKSNKLLSIGFEWISAAIASLVLVSVLFSCVFRTVNVDGDSMTNTLSDGDTLLLSTMPYEPSYGDVVVIRRENDTPLIKRVIGLPKDVIRIDNNGRVFRNGLELVEPYIKENFTPQNGMTLTITVENNTLFVMGDNRGGSLDSRMLGCLPQENVVGKVFYRLAPLPGPITNGE